jgi:phage terminase large subunit GpA-like protein
MHPALADCRRATLAAFAPPPRIRLSTWLEASIVLPEGATHAPGPLRLAPYMVEIADSIGDPAIERVTLQKCVRIGLHGPGRRRCVVRQQ